MGWGIVQVRMYLRGKNLNTSGTVFEELPKLFNPKEFSFDQIKDLLDEACELTKKRRHKTVQARDIIGIYLKREGNALFCERCGYPNPKSRERCATCGYHLEGEIKMKYCKHCGKLIPKISYLCEYCGKGI